MCGRYTLTTPGGRALAERFAVGGEDVFEPTTLERFNVCPTEPVAIVAAEREERVAHTVRWGLVPPWAHELGKGFQPINARSETAADKAPFAADGTAGARCLVLADGWYEWLKAEKKGGDAAAVPLHGRRRRAVRVRRPLVTAPDRRRVSAILTSAANSVCAPVHDRMPSCSRGPTSRGGVAGARGRRRRCSSSRSPPSARVGRARQPGRQQGGRRRQRAAHGAAARRARSAQPGHLRARCSDRVRAVRRRTLALVVGRPAGCRARRLAGRRASAAARPRARARARHGDRVRRPRLDRLRRLRARAHRSAIVALACILFEGGLSSGFDEIRPVLRTSIALATLGTLVTAGLTAIAAGAAARPRAARGAAARLDRGRHRRRGRVRGPARIDAAAAARAHARGRVRHQRPDRDPARDRLHRGAPATRASGSPTRCCWRSCELSIGFVVGLAVAGLAVLFLRRVHAAVRRPVPGRLGRDRGARLRRAPSRSTARASSPCTSPGSCSGTRLDAGAAHDRHLPRRARVGRPARAVPHRSACSSSRPSSIEIIPRGHRDRDRHRGRRAAAGGAARRWARLHAARAADARLGGPARRDTDRVRHVRGHRGHPQDGLTIFNVAFFVVLLSTVLQGTTIEPVARLLGVTSDEAAIPAPLVEPVLLNRLGAEVDPVPGARGRRGRRPPGARARACRARRCST